MRKWRKRVTVALATVAVLSAVGYAYFRYTFPYGVSHCCDKILFMALTEYADGHGGWFPRGGGSPEASLGLLHTANPELANPELLRGKTVPVSAVRERLEAGLPLTAETSGWHYVEGLRIDDDPRLVLFWDKVGLGHQGQRLSDGGHWVMPINGIAFYVPGEKWEEFLEEQQRLRAAIKR